MTDQILNNGEVDRTDSGPLPPASDVSPAKAAKSVKSAKKASRSSKKQKSKAPKRVVRIYPSASFKDVLLLGEAIHKYAAGQQVRRLTLLQKMEKSPTSSITQMLITNSSKYGVTKGSFRSEWLELTDLGAIATNPTTTPRVKREAQFKLSIQGIKPFEQLYLEYRGKRLPAHEVIKDRLKDLGFDLDDPQECLDYFIVNVKDLGLIQLIAGSETLIPIEQLLDELGATPAANEPEEQTPASTTRVGVLAPGAVAAGLALAAAAAAGRTPDWSSICFIITPIGSEGSEERQHADLFLGHIIEPALREFGLRAVRADQIGEGGMITSQILQYVIRSRLAIADLSFHNPNAFYEMAVRHMCRMPIVQISRKIDPLPFDLNQVRTVVIDTATIYTLIPRLESYRSEIATQVRAALEDGGATQNPISVFFPEVSVTLPK